MSSNCSDLNVARKKLEEALGDNATAYFQAMKLWFQMKCSREDFNKETHQLLNDDQRRLHNEFLLCLFTKCQSLSFCQPNLSLRNQSFDYSSSKKTKSKKKFRSDKGGFEPADIADYIPQLQPPPPQAFEEPIRYCSQELFLPDTSLIFGRLLLAAWERGLEGADENAAEFLVVAVQHLLKNVLTAVLSRKNGYKVREGSFIHGIGCAVPNPWLRNTIKAMNYNKTSRIDFDEDDEIDDEFDDPLKKQTIDDIEQKAAYEIACGTDNVLKSPITVYHILQALQVYPHIIPSDSVYSVYVEKVISKLRHPSREEIEIGC